ncbi:hypothetical protein J1N35_028706 [Gossypium stocksii]|uniref:RNase H type-1 domain-containing protein n=1 Tax=Gossypium stocksii TaxID=47602 RepID=A0A9D3UX90_9ROSI|nr:hypothetical protein J1N35_028706 [Gossypium stocksii]
MWWMSNGKTRGWVMMAWDRMCHPKGMGGIGSWNMHIFNLALLGRQVWRLMHFKNTLCFKAVDALKDGFVWLAGDGNMIDIHRNLWEFEGLNGDSYASQYDKIARIWQNFSNIYPRCKNIEETLIHALKDCPMTREILTLGSLNNRLLDGSYDRCIDWLEDVLRELDAKAAVDFFTLIWNCWNSRNKLVFHGKEDTALVVWEREKALSNDFRIYNLVDPLVIPANPVSKCWMKPPHGYVKINFDAAVSNGRVGYGAIARDTDGFVLEGCCGFEEKPLDAN